VIIQLDEELKGQKANIQVDGTAQRAILFFIFYFDYHTLFQCNLILICYINIILNDWNCFFFIIIINKGVRVRLRVSRLISQSLKLTAI
jgi:hypothetical protein